jgi:ABC-type lipoprotein release transport system permease subunit
VILPAAPFCFQACATLVLVILAIGLTVLAATILPARQAARTDPAQSLRSP